MMQLSKGLYFLISVLGIGVRWCPSSEAPLLVEGTEFPVLQGSSKIMTSPRETTTKSRIRSVSAAVSETQNNEPITRRDSLESFLLNQDSSNKLNTNSDNINEKESLRELQEAPGCRFVNGDDGSVTTFDEGESMGDFAVVSVCANNVPSSFPCYCLSSAPGQTVCPYCFFRDTFNQIICGRGGIENKVGLLHPNRTFVHCSCDVLVERAAAAHESYTVDVGSTCDMEQGVAVTYANPILPLASDASPAVPVPPTAALPTTTITAPTGITAATPEPTSSAPTSMLPTSTAPASMQPTSNAPNSPPPTSKAPSVSSPPTSKAPSVSSPPTSKAPSASSAPTSNQPSVSSPPTSKQPTVTPATLPPVTTVPVTYQPGNLTTRQEGLWLSEGLSARIIAVAGRPVRLEAQSGLNDGGLWESPEEFHPRPDGADVFEDLRPSNPGGWIFASNSEVSDGGVGAVTFNAQGQVIWYEMILRGSSYNCNGGRTPWGTWVTAEEDFDRAEGRLWQVDPMGIRDPQILTLGSEGGVFEAFAYDNRKPNLPRFFLTEDDEKGALRRWTPAGVFWESDPWNMLHGPGQTEYLILEPDFVTPGVNGQHGTFRWTTEEKEARENAKDYYPNSEGIAVDGKWLYFVIKEYFRLFRLNLDTMVYQSVSTRAGLFDGEPDQIRSILQNDGSSLLYFSEDWGELAGIHARDDAGQLFTILEMPSNEPETTGISFSPDGKHLYFTNQHEGILFDITRDDGLSFHAKTVNLKPRLNEDPARFRRKK